MPLRHEFFSSCRPCRRIVGHAYPVHLVGQMLDNLSIEAKRKGCSGASNPFIFNLSIGCGGQI